MTTPVIATRGSKLALWQANYIAELLAKHGMATEQLIIKTEGDRVQDRFLHEIGGKGLFIRELETAMREGRAQLAMHSLKDMPAQLPPGFVLGAVLKRHSPRDILILSPQGAKKWNLGERQDPLTVEDMKSAPTINIATASLRRQCLLKKFAPQLTLSPIRGNVDTRLRKLDEDGLDGLILAEASLHRLSIHREVAVPLDPNWFVPSAAQGALAVECPADSPHRDVIANLDDPTTHTRVDWERGVLAALGGDCTMPFGAFYDDQNGQATVLDNDGNQASYAFTGPLTRENLQDRIGETLKGLVNDGLEPIMKNLQLPMPETSL